MKKVLVIISMALILCSSLNAKFVRPALFSQNPQYQYVASDGANRDRTADISYKGYPQIYTFCYYNLPYAIKLEYYTAQAGLLGNSSGYIVSVDFDTYSCDYTEKAYVINQLKRTSDMAHDNYMNYNGSSMATGGAYYGRAMGSSNQYNWARPTLDLVELRLSN